MDEMICYQPSEVDEDELDVGFTDDGLPMEVIFAEIEKNNYFGEMGLQAEGRERICSVWAL